MSQRIKLIALILSSFSLPIATSAFADEPASTQASTQATENVPLSSAEIKILQDRQSAIPNDIQSKNDLIDRSAGELPTLDKEYADATEAVHQRQCGRTMGRRQVIMGKIKDHKAEIEKLKAEITSLNEENAAIDRILSGQMNKGDFGKLREGTNEKLKELEKQ